MLASGFYSIGNIKVNDLLLDTENFRYEKNTLNNQYDCIEAILKDPKAKVVNLAQSIADFG